MKKIPKTHSWTEKNVNLKMCILRNAGIHDFDAAEN